MNQNQRNQRAAARNQGVQLNDHANETDNENVFADLIPEEDYASTIVHPRVGATSWKIDSSLYRLLKLEGYLWNSTENDPQRHLQNFVDACAHPIQNNVSQDVIRLRLFKYSLAGEARTWFKKLPRNSITSWAEIAWHLNNADIVPYGNAMIQNMAKENQDTQQKLVQLATNISLLTKKFDENQIKKVNICKDASSMPKGMYQVQEGPYHEEPLMQVEDANYVNKSQGGYQRQNFQEG
ncbi:uncharacterized protein LOC132046098 [Lycium ferocissimum]|uniref:uncharacterized protein LOC132046098 n=1 Tax=Lycium ferocissimum TaxID=112874 RepID=UPI002814A145|nr:uncharacterized protein LOC132046098 [Lycium ferocissimum]